MTTSKNMSVQERIRALNIQNTSSSGSVGNTPPRQGSQPSPTSAAPVAIQPGSSPKSPPPSSSPSSEKAQLFKAAKLIQKSFDAETDIWSRTQQAAAAAEAASAHTVPPLQSSSPAIDEEEGEGDAHDVDESHVSSHRRGSLDELELDSYDDDVNDEEEEIDASAALKYWTTKGASTSDGPRSYRDAMRDTTYREAIMTSRDTNTNTNYLSSASNSRTTSNNDDEDEMGSSDNAKDHVTRAILSSFTTATSQQQGAGLDIHIMDALDTTHGEAQQLETEEAKPPSPPDIVRTANSDSNMNQDVVGDEQYIHDDNSQEEYDHEQQHQQEEEEEQEDDFDGALYNVESAEEDTRSEEAEIAPSDESSMLSAAHQPLAPLKTDFILDDAHLHITPEEEDDFPSSMKSTSRGHVRSSSASSATGALPYRAYARRSRLRSSPRGQLVTSPDNSMEMDGTQSVFSACTAHSVSSQASTSLTQMSSLSSRATRFLKDKKDKRKLTGGTGGAATADGGLSAGASSNPTKPDAYAKDIAHNILRGKASKEIIRKRVGQKAASMTHIEQGKGDLNLKSVSPIDEDPGGGKGRMASSGRGRPQTIDLEPSAMPKMGTTGDRLSGLNIDVGTGGQYHKMDNPPPVASSNQMSSIQKAYISQQSYGSIPTADTQSTESTKEHPTKNKQDRLVGRSYFDHTVSMDESSYSAQQAKDLFDTGAGGKHHENDTRSIQPSVTSPRSEANATLESNTEFSAFPRTGGGKSFDSGCQVFEAINPLIESACNALSPVAQAASESTKHIFGTNPTTGASRFVANTFCNDAPSDEDVAIEVEYVEQGVGGSGGGEDNSNRSLSAETDSTYSVSTRDLDSYA